MEQTYFPKSVNCDCIDIDKFCDFIPFVSTLTNSINLIILISFKVSNTPQDDTVKAKLFTQDQYVQYLNQKGFASCILLAIPFLNIFFAIYNWLDASESAKTFDIEDQEDSDSSSSSATDEFKPKSFFVSKENDESNSTFAFDKPLSIQLSQEKKPLVVAEKSFKTNKELALDFFLNLNILDEMTKLKIDPETCFVAFNEISDLSWEAIQPYLKDLVFLSATQVNTPDSMRWFLSVPQNKSNFLDFIDACEGLSPSYKQNFLRKLAQMHNHSVDFHTAYEERNLHTHEIFNIDALLQPKVWSSLEPMLKDIIFPQIPLKAQTQGGYRYDSQDIFARVQFCVYVKLHAKAVVQ